MNRVLLFLCALCVFASLRCAALTTAERDTNHFHWPQLQPATLKLLADYDRRIAAFERLNAPPPFPEEARTAESASSESDGPLTYLRTITWDASAHASTYVLTVNGTLWMVATNLVSDVPLTAGTNHLTLYAVNTNGTSPTVSTNYFIAVLTITGGEIVTASSPLGPWTVTNLPSVQTNATGPAQYFTLRPWRKEVIDERHVP